MIFGLVMDGAVWGTITAALALAGVVYSEGGKRLRNRQSAKKRNTNEPDLAMDRLLRFINEIQEQAESDRKRLREVQAELDTQRDISRTAFDRSADLERDLRNMTRRVEELEMEMRKYS